MLILLKETIHYIYYVIGFIMLIGLKETSLQSVTCTLAFLATYGGFIMFPVKKLPKFKMFQIFCNSKDLWHI